VSVHRFGSYRFDSAVDQLTADGVATRLEPRVSDLLLYFLDNPDRLVSRDELLAAVWKGRPVSDDTINRAISILRQALNTPDRQAIVRTVPRRGYIASFPDPPGEGDATAGPADDATSGADTDPAPTRATRASVLARLAPDITLQLSAFGALCLIAILIGASWNSGTNPARAEPVIAVLEFVNNGEAEAAFIATGISDNIISLLSLQRRLRVVARTSTFTIDQAALSISGIGDRLNADYVLEGTVHLLDGQLRVNARLIEVATETTVWSSTFSERPEDLVQVLDTIAQSTTIEVLGSIAAVKDNTPYQPRFPAYQQAMLGQQALSHRTNAGLQAAKRHFEAAIELDPNYALAHALLAGTLHELNQIHPITQEYDGEVFPAGKIDELILRAITLEPGLGEAYNQQGRILLQRGKPGEAESVLRRAIELNPSNADAHANTARVLQSANKLEQAIMHARQAVRLNPQDNRVNQLLAVLLWQFGRAEEAVATLEENVRKNPTAANNNSLLGRWALQMGDGFRAMQYALNEWRLEPDNPNRHWGVCLTHIQIWDEDTALRCIDHLLSLHPDYYEARNWKLMLLRERESSLELTRAQVKAFPDAAYYKLQLANKLNDALQFEASLDVLRTLYPELLDGPIAITDLNIWGARMVGHALLKTGREDRGTRILEEVLAHIGRSRVLQSGGYTLGVDDAMALAALGRTEQAIDILAARVGEGWIFYSQIVFHRPETPELGAHPAFRSLAARIRERLEGVQERIRKDLGPDLGCSTSPLLETAGR